MRASVAKKLCCLFGFLWCFSTYAQQGLEMTVKVEDGKARSNLVDVLIGLTNSTESPFEGFIQINTPAGFKSISEPLVPISLEPGEKRFISSKLLRQPAALVGISTIGVDLLDAHKKVLQTQETAQTVKENNHMRLFTESPMVLLTNPNDTLVLKVTVSNLGNKIQDATVVFSIPNLTGEKNFFEKNGVVPIGEDTDFILRFLPPRSLLTSPQFTVQIAAMRGPGKDLFGNTSITVQNISSSKQHHDLGATRDTYNSHRNSITTSYRRLGANTNSYQVIGSADVNLSAGYLAMDGNMYLTENADIPYITNTSLTYHLDNYSLKVGNISQQLEMPLYGRGIASSITNRDNNRTLELGFIDQNYNLIEQNAFLKRGYGMYVSSVFGNVNTHNYTLGSYVFKEDKMDNSRNHMLGMEKAYRLGEGWRLNVKGNAAISDYEEIDESQTSYALETQYSGNIKRVKLSGNYFLSSDYFPGNRRGVIQIHQNASKNISKNRSIYSNLFISNYSPKSHTYKINYASTNYRFNMGINFPRRKVFGLRLGFYHHTETRTNFGESDLETTLGKMSANRITNSLNWSSLNRKHSVLLGMEEGLVKYANESSLKPQLKTNLMYRFAWINANATYQYGSFYLSESTLAQQNTSTNQEYQRLLFSVSANKNFLEDKLAINSGLNYNNNFQLGSNTSTFLNIHYQPNNRYRLFLNTSWSQYQTQRNDNYVYTSQNNQFTLEAGLTINFKGKAPSTARKGKIRAQAYFDHNANNVFDEGDEIAPDYLIKLNDAIFKTDQNGELVYRSVPFGTYTINSVAAQGWFTNEQEFELNAYHQQLSIPLHQTGSVTGKIRYEYDPMLSKKFQPKIAGILFNISKDGKHIQRISTTNDGEFTVFLPNGTYQISLDKGSLASKTHCEQPTASFTVESGKTNKLSPFKILVEQKSIKVKRFGK